MQILCYSLAIRINMRTMVFLFSIHSKAPEDISVVQCKRMCVVAHRKVG